MPPPPYRRISLADRFAGLRRSGLPPIKAAQLLEKQWYAYHFHTADFDLPSNCDWGVDGAGNLTLKLPDGRALDPRKTMTRPPGEFDPYPIPFSQIAALKPNSELIKAAMLDADAQVGPSSPSPAPRKPESYAEKLAAIEAYRKEHDCSADAAYAALHGELGHNSGDALKMWLSRNKPEGK